MPTNSVPKMGANLGPIKRNFDVPVRLHFGSGLGAMWRHKALFWRPKLGSLLGGPSWPTIHFIIIFLLESNQNWIVGQLGPPNKEPNLGLQKIFLWRPRRPNPPSKMDPNLGLKKLIWGAYLVVRFGHHVGDLKAPKRFFLRGQWRPKNPPLPAGALTIRF